MFGLSVGLIEFGCVYRFFAFDNRGWGFEFLFDEWVDF